MGSLNDLNPSLPQGLSDACAVYWRAFAEALRPDPELALSDWADRNRWLSAKGAAEPGQWRTERTPYLREIMDCLSPSHPCTHVDFMKGTQIGGTEAGYNWIGGVIDLWPGPMMVVMPTTDTAKRTSKQRLAPMIEETAVLRAKVQDARARDSGNTLQMKEFPGGVLVLTGANSGPGLRSMPVRYLMMDEIDAYPDDVDGEGDPCVVAEKRTDTFARRKIYRVSSPKAKTGRISRYYEASDQRRYHVPCPHCAHEQWLRWDRVRWKMREISEWACTACGVVSDAPAEHGGCQGCNAPSDALRATTRESDEAIEAVWYECESCQEPILEAHKTAMLAAGRWVAHKPGAGRNPGFHLSALYSPVGWFSWRQAVEQYLKAKQDTTGEHLKTWTNTVLGEGYEEKGQKAEPKLLRERVEPYRIGTVPAGALMLVASVDTQDDRLEYKVKGWGRGEESWLIDYGQIYGNPAQPETWAELEKLLDKSYPHVWGGSLRILAMAIDSGGHHTQSVYLFCAKWAHRHVFAVKGANTAGRPVLGRPSMVEINHKGMVIKDGCRLYPIGTDTAKSAIFNRLDLKAGAGALHFPTGLPDAYFEQFTAEKRVERWVKGSLRFQWLNSPGARNEAIDLEVYNYAAAIYAGVTRTNWEVLEESMRQVGLFSSQPAQPAAVAETIASETDSPPPPPPPDPAPRAIDATPTEPAAGGFFVGRRENWLQPRPNWIR